MRVAILPTAMIGNRQRVDLTGLPKAEAIVLLIRAAA